jgi:hypothetical protein
MAATLGNDDQPTPEALELVCEAREWLESIGLEPTMAVLPAAIAFAAALAAEAGLDPAFVIEDGVEIPPEGDGAVALLAYVAAAAIIGIRVVRDEALAEQRASGSRPVH